MKKSDPNELQREKAKLNQQIQELSSMIEYQNEVKKGFQAKLRQVNTTLSNMLKTKPVTITDHAVLRYLEKVRGVDVEEARAEMLTDTLQKQIDTLGGTGKYVVEYGTAVTKDYTMVTCYPANP